MYKRQEPTVIAKLETAYRRDEKVIRYMTVKLDKYAAAYACLLYTSGALPQRPAVEDGRSKGAFPGYEQLYLLQCALHDS